MAMHLFEHNQSAYEAAIAMLAETGKAAVIHPTGTGKSFIGFKLCEDHPDQRILWLSPSEYIFKTQLENWAAAGGESIDNIVFLTYAKLVNLTDADMAELRPDYIVLDEFHRGGAEIWGAALNKLLSEYVNTPMLGLSATNIRYLDNQRDMADELFDNNIASEMMLGDAIVRGILNPPKYILSIYSYQKELEKYEKRVHKAKNKAVRDEATLYLEALRRALENADGLDVVFDRHMTDRHGKYIVFTPNYETMQEYIGMAKEWFGKIDPKMHIYSVYSDDPSASKSFRDFKADESDHLRLLYCIDALNEGVHVEDVSGVILLRPTISPIIYKQQIGRALSASKSREPVIFDIVNNIENLYSIDAIMDEMRNAIYYYRSHEGEKLIVNDSFEVIDKLAECKALFEQLEGALSASWDIMYSHAEAYFDAHQTLEMPKNYRTAEGYSLWSWLSVQRRVRAGKVNGILTDEQIERLDRIGMRWDSVKDVSWNKFYSAAVAYYNEMHSLTPLATYVTPDGIRLGAWLAQLRTARNIGMNSSYLTPEHIAELDAIGMVWDVYDFVFERNYHSAVEYFRKYGNLDCKTDYVDNDGVKLGAWLNYLRAQYKKRGRSILTDEQFRMLDAIGMRWSGKFDQQWDDCFNCLVSYVARTGDTDVPATWKEGTTALGAWLRRQKEQFMKGELRADRTEKLAALGVNLTIEEPWEAKFKLAKAYSEAHGGSLAIPHDLKVNGVWLNKWVNDQRLMGEGKRKKTLTDEQRARLESIGMVFGQTSNDQAWEQHYQAVKSYIEASGSTEIPKDLKDSDGVDLKHWLRIQIGYARKGKLAAEKTEKLKSLGVVFEQDDPFEIGYAHAKAYFEKHGNLLVLRKNDFRDDGFRLSSWVHNLRSRKKKGRLTDEQIRRLEAIGMVWNAQDAVWEEMFEAAKQFAVSGKPLVIPVHQRTENDRDLYDWYSRQRRAYAEGKLPEEKLKKLLSIGAVMEQVYKRKPKENAGISQVIRRVDPPQLGNAVNG